MTRCAPIDRCVLVHRFVPSCVAVLWLVCGGCSGPIFRPQSPEATLDTLTVPDVHLTSEYTHPYGMDYVQVEAVSLVTGLAGTGSDPPPTPQRAMLLAEMNRRGVENPNEVLASPNTAMVLVRGFMRPGIQKGDHFDVEVRSPSHSDATSLRGGWLLSTRLTELAVLGQQIRQGHVLATVEGPVLVDPSANAKDEPALLTRGRILGRGVTLKSRSLGLILNQEHRSIRLSGQIAKSINLRFHSYVNGRKEGMATPKTDEFIDLAVHPRYKDNVGRYMRVVRNIAVEESPAELQARMLLLEHQLADPLTAANAAIRLEAIGNEQAVEMLEASLKSSDPEVRFYAAEALAYLDQTAAVETLADVARHEPAFRVNALAALSAMDDVMAYDALRSLLEVRSAETRYGAFRALWAMNEHDPLVRGEELGGQFTFHELDVAGPPMIHVTRSYRPEVVLFGKDQHFQLPLVLDAGKNILVNGLSGGKITISRFSTGTEPEQRVVSTSVAEVARTIVELGGTYPDVVQALEQAKHDGALAGRFAIDALPQIDRPYDRSAPHDYGSDAQEAAPDQEQDEPLEVSTPPPDLFTQQR
jgi:flagellar basal body P-ring protein FlgI